MWQKTKTFVIRHKWWVVGGVGLLILFIMTRSKSGGGGDEYAGTMQGYGVSQSYDPTMDIMGMQSQMQLAGMQQQMDMQTKAFEQQYQSDLLASGDSRYMIDAQSQLGLADIDMQKYLGNLSSTTSQFLGQLQADTTIAQSNIQLEAEGIRNQTARYEMDAGKYIADKQYSIAKREAKTAKQGQQLGFISNMFGQAISSGRFF